MFVIFLSCLSISGTKRQQGQCSESSSTLPKHWVNEGPGPPICAPACTDLLKTTFVIKTADSNIKMDEKNRFYENQQCLDYLGDDKLTSSPEQICKKSSREISNILRTLRLRHCCERNVYSALHDDGMSAVHNGGKACEQILRNLIDADALASRITCGLNEILFRYDCRQVYSIKHGCNDCKVNGHFIFFSYINLDICIVIFVLFLFYNQFDRGMLPPDKQRIDFNSAPLCARNTCILH